MSTHVFKISLCYDEKWEIKLCISVKYGYIYDEKWEIKLCFSVNIYHRLPKLGMSTPVFKIRLCYDNKL